VDDGQEEIKAQVGSLASRIAVNQQEMKTVSDTCLDKMEAKAGELQSVAVHQEVPKEEAAVKPIRALKKRYGERHLAVGRREKPKERTQGKGGVPEETGCRRRGKTRRAGVAQLKGHCLQGQCKDKDVEGTRKGRMFGSRLRKTVMAQGTETSRSTYVKREDLRQDRRENHRAGDRKANSRIFHQDSKNEGLDIVEGPVPSQTVKETARRVGPGGVGAPASKWAAYGGKL
jgi:hypothetical protein